MSLTSLFTFKPRTAIITGASHGIGAAVAERLAKDGLAVVINYSSGTEDARALVAKIAAAGGIVSALTRNWTPVGLQRFREFSLGTIVP